VGPGDLGRILSLLHVPSRPEVIAGMDVLDDAGVFRLGEETALVHTVDFFTPIVDDPYDFGRIAAANALSDVYAMGAEPVTALNIVCFPVGVLPVDVLRRILEGGISVLEEAGAALVGGHTIEDKELKYGLAVTGTVDPRQLVRTRGCRPGDVLVLTKPLGTGIVNTALKGGVASAEHVKAAVEVMTALNDVPASLFSRFHVSACTDVTGFGLAGHAAEMVETKEAGMEIDVHALPVLEGVRRYAEEGFLPGGLHRNREHARGNVRIDPGVPSWWRDVLFDPQTSGGLLVALPAGSADEFVNALRERGKPHARVIGRVTEEHPGIIEVRP